MNINYPEYVETKKGKRYKINTSYKVVLEIEEIHNDESICDEEKTLAILFLLFGEKALNNINDWPELVDLASIYLRCGQSETENMSKPDIDYLQDIAAIRMSFLSDYKVDLEVEDMHFYKFFEGLCNLTENSSLSRIRELRNYDISLIKDEKTKNKIIQAQKKVELKQNKKVIKSDEEKEIDNYIVDQLIGVS